MVTDLPQFQLFFYQFNRLLSLKITIYRSDNIFNINPWTNDFDWLFKS